MTPIQALRYIAANPLTPPQIRDVAMQGIASADVEAIVQRAKNDLPAQYITAAHRLIDKRAARMFGTGPAERAFRASQTGHVALAVLDVLTVAGGAAFVFAKLVALAI